MTIEQAIKEHPRKTARELWEAHEEFRKIDYVTFASQWHTARMKALKPKKANTTGHDDIDSASKPEAPTKSPVKPAEA